MISRRQHAVSIAAIFLALAIGVVMGSGLLSSGLVSGLRDDKAGLQTDIEKANERNNQLTEQLNSADGFDSAVGGRVVVDSLAQRTVMVVTTPDADPADLDGINRIVAAAGGSVTGRVSLTDAFVDATGGDRLRTVVNNVIPAGVTLRTGAIDQGSLAGDLLGSVLLLDKGTGTPQSSAEEMALALQTLRGAGFISYEDGAVQPAELAVVLTGNHGANEGVGGNRGAVVARFAGAFDARGGGAVLAGRSGSAQGNGAVAVARADAALSAALTTIDNIDREAGKITIPLALQEQLAGGAGRYGTGPGAGGITVAAAPS
ncbi:copper transporter [Rhodococcus marinonascens]|uniref:copper transporter n=1 Tax=Rhodococcus marinonascens TaxID=38311 RepID=UPI000932B3D6|nr:copper transporter [Rhodococcus marinonascens]